MGTAFGANPCCSIHVCTRNSRHELGLSPCAQVPLLLMLSVRNTEGLLGCSKSQNPNTYIWQYIHVLWLQVRIHIYANKHLSEADSSDPSLVEPLESEEDILLEAFLRGAVTFSQQDPPALEDRRLRV